MKRIVISIFVISVLIGGIIGSPPAHGEPPVGVGLVLTDWDGNIKNSFQAGEKIMVAISLDNIPEEDVPEGDRIDIATSAGFSNKKFHLMLQFIYTDENNKQELITAKNQSGSADSPPPEVILVAGTKILLQAEEVELLESGWAIKLQPFPGQGFYNLDKSGKYTAQVVIPIRTYPLDAVQTSGIKKFAELDEKDFDKEITSNLEPFTIEEVVAIAGDFDGDGDVDRNDLNIILAARNTPASGPDDPRDLDGDGMITALDARKLVLMCTKPRCATE